MSEKFLFARTILTKEVNKIGGEIFAEKMMRLQAEHGDEEAKKVIDAQDLFLKIVSHESTETEAERKLSELVEAIQVLYHYDKKSPKPESKE